jgi:hypothetical protein
MTFDDQQRLEPTMATGVKANPLESL